MEIIKVDGLEKKFGPVEAVRGVSFTLGEGEIFGFLGPNGAGKSTTIKILATLLRPTSGQACIAGMDVVRQPVQVRRAIGVVFQDYSLDDRLTAEENLYIHAMLYGVTGQLYQERKEQVLGMVGLGDRRRSLVRTFSGGMKRRLEIARGLLHHPRVLFLDEPTVGLDPQTRKTIWDHIHRLRREVGTTVFMTTHYMDEAENCDRIGIIDHGTIVALDTPQALKLQVGGDVVTLETVDNQALGEEIASRYQVQIKETQGGLSFRVDRGPEFIPRLAADFPGQITRLSVHQPTLEDVFLQLTGRAIREEALDVKDQFRQRFRTMRRGR